MMDAAQEIRNKHITKEEGLALMKRFEGEYPARYEKEFLDYISMSKEEFSDLLIALENNPNNDIDIVIEAWRDTESLVKSFEDLETQFNKTFAIK
jgi:hypothetical protein